jgi:hypothetical protein
VFGDCDQIGFANDWRRVTGALKRADDDGSRLPGRERRPFLEKDRNQ